MNPCDARVLVMGGQRSAPVSNMLFGQFIELAGRCINNGLYDPESPLARADGLRPDVIEAIRELHPGYLRYPGGCAAAYFDWQELVGPVSERPRAKLFRRAGGAQSTAFGIPEAWALCQELDTELYLTVNAHTQSPEDAANLVEYLNGTRRTKWTELRRSHGREKPYGVKYFGLGNEIHGDWQPGQKTADEYARWCREAIRNMKWVDPGIVTIACGCGRADPRWDRTVLEGLHDCADLISIHNYFGRPVFKDSMAASLVCQEMIGQTNANIDETRDRHLGSKRRPGIALDEWNVWYRSSHGEIGDLEEIYNYADALTVASLLHTILRNSDTVKMANLSLAVNTLGLIFTDARRMARQTIWHAQKLIQDAHHGGQLLRTVAEGPVFSAKHERFFCGIVSPEKAQDETVPSLLHFSNVPGLDVLASIDEGRRRLTLSVVQKLEDEALDVEFSFWGMSPKRGRAMKRSLVSKGGVLAANTLDEPDLVGITSEVVELDGRLTFPPASLTVLELDVP
jgi:alpha-N-arabinofuranosidase